MELRLSYVCLAGALLLTALPAQQPSSGIANTPANSAITAPSPPPPAPATPAAPPADDSAANNADLIESITVREVIAPVTVLDKSGALVDGIESGRFHLYDNGMSQNISVDVSTQPISLVLAIQQSDRVDAVLSQIHKIGPMIQPLVTGDTGEAAVISFDSRIQVKQDFTNDADKLDRAIKSIHSGTTPNRMIDAVERGVLLLRNRPSNRRRIIVLVSETRDVSSEARLRETLIAAQLANVSIFSVDISQIVTSLSSKPIAPRTSALPPSAYNLPGPTPATPTSVNQKSQIGNRVEFVPLLKEIYLGTKRIFIDNPVEVLTEGTGGTQFAFKRTRGLEEAIEDLSREIHSQYLISYNPKTSSNEEGFHQIRVDVDLPDLIVRTRPGYFVGGK